MINMETKKHIITVTSVKIYQYEIISNNDNFDAMDHAMHLMTDIDNGDDSCLISSKMSWDHDCDEYIEVDEL